MLMLSARRSATAAGIAVVFALLLAVEARATAPPVGALPKGSVTTVTTPHGSLLAVALPRQSAASGLVWRVARTVDAKVLQQVSEADVGASVVVVFKTVKPGRARVVFALTKGESSPKALRAVSYAVTAT